MSLEWISVSTSAPCPICGKPDWCAISADGKFAICRRECKGGQEKRDQNGATYYSHLLEAPLPPMKRTSEVKRETETAYERADADTLYLAYSTLLNSLSLSDAHRQQLQKRGLSDEQIQERGYKSLGRNGRVGQVSKMEEVLKEKIFTIPGISSEKKLLGAVGLLVPCRDSHGRIVALKIRRDDAKGDGPKYVYLSSAKKGGPGPGAQVHVPCGTIIPAEVVRLTEGELKADVAFSLTKVPTLSIPGVGNWRGALDVLNDLGAKQVLLAFDADAKTNKNVARSLLECARALVEAGFRVGMEVWEQSDGKGIDDLVVAGKLPSTLFDNDAMNAIELIAKELGVVQQTPASTDTNSQTSAIRQEITDCLEKDGPIGLYDDSDLFNRIAETAVKDKPGYAAIRVILRSYGIKSREFDKAIKPLIVAKTKEQPTEVARDEAGGFFESDGQLCRMKLTTEGPVIIPLCNFIAKIVDETIYDDGALTNLVLGVEGSLFSGAQLSRVEVPAIRFQLADWFLEKWGSDLIVWPNERKSLPAAIQALSDKKVRKRVCIHTGWRQIDGVWCYLHGGGAIGLEAGDTKFSVHLKPPLCGFEFPQVGDLESAKKAVNATLGVLDLAPDNITVPLIGSVLRAVLGDADFSLFLAGSTGVFKSELAALAQQHFGAALDARHLPGNWSSTPNSTESAAFLAKDAVFVLDDFVPNGSISDMQRLHQFAERIFRAQGNFSARQRMSSDGSLIPAKPPRGLIISTGEDIPHGQSLRARLLLLEIGPGDVNVNRLTACQKDAAAGLYALFTAGFIAWLAPQYSEVKAKLTQRIEEIRAQATSSGQHARAPGIQAGLFAAWEIFGDYACDTLNPPPEFRESLLNRVWRALETAIAAQAVHQQSENAAEKFIRMIRNAIGNRRAHLVGLNGEAPDGNALVWGWQRRLRTTTGDDIDPCGNPIGWVDGDQVFLDPDASVALAYKLADELREPILVSRHALSKSLAERGFLTTTDKARKTNTIRKVISGQRREVYCLRASTLIGENLTNLTNPTNDLDRDGNLGNSDADSETDGESFGSDNWPFETDS